ncbi:GspH/FimT family pseudopilin [Ectopseudomonas hydrolytica]|uniref:Type II secretion system protein H n=1 Tax=Ectopseudomonas hydrolytica TaxID=2493633 RepID=A0ABY5AA90_9GAMM|nr:MULTISPECIES: GspH/FimT family pseudopilin [Pseudomonas]MDH0098363.1 GspH/FimT family pseudopilin [Pseudomonas sp. GD04158]USR40809.1 GspH/FimT family pseudopilin [Pseudomonas hydrolytica]
MESSRGFTLIELMVVIALIAIVSSIAVPSYQAMMESGRETSARNSLLGALQLARSEAIARRASVSVTTTGSTWIVSDGSEDIRVVSIPTGVTASNVAVTFQANGRPQTTASINVGGRNIEINTIGRASLTSSTSNNTPQSSEGTE